MESEKVENIKKALEQNIKTGIGYLDEKEDKMFFVSIADILTLINKLESENIKLKYKNSGVYYCNCKEKVECWALQKNGACTTFENCQYKISEMEYELNKLKGEEK